MKRSLAAMLALGLFLAGAVAAPAEEPAAVAAGRDVALKICANCHLVAEGQPKAPILEPPAPSFRAIARRADATDASLRTFLSEPHGTSRQKSAMPPFLLAPAQIREVVAYLLSLRAEE